MTNQRSRKLIMTQYGEDFRACSKIVDAEIGEPGHGEVLVLGRCGCARAGR